MRSRVANAAATETSSFPEITAQGNDAAVKAAQESLLDMDLLGDDKSALSLTDKNERSRSITPAGENVDKEQDDDKPNAS